MRPPFTRWSNNPSVCRVFFLMSNVITFRVYGNLGDTIYCLAGMRAVCDKLNATAILYTALDIPADYYDGAKHETTDKTGRQVMMSEYTFNMIKPLVVAQDFIEDYRIWKGEKVTVDLTRMHREFVNMPNGNIAHWCAYLFPDMWADLSKPWLDVPYSEEIDRDFASKILINRTARYNNPHISFWFLKEYQDKLLFVGTEKECQDFNEKWELKIPYLQAYSFLHLAQAIWSCKFFVGGQSFTFSIAEALKVPRILEVCEFAQNVHPQGVGGYDYLYQGGLEYYFNQLIK
jgi:hypothetical protein